MFCKLTTVARNESFFTVAVYSANVSNHIVSVEEQPRGLLKEWSRMVCGAPVNGKDSAAACTVHVLASEQSHRFILGKIQIMRVGGIRTHARTHVRTENTQNKCKLISSRSSTPMSRFALLH